ncbi:MAG: NYN domain-containing protein, partial [Acidimicrobiia bacterium]|nr:NYN domain-containing protein [Acidimicrobiia bacterium]
PTGRSREAARPHLRFPAGLAPDQPEGVRALLDDQPDAVFIDGYNVAGAVDASLVGSREGRNAAIRVADRIKRTVPAADVVVVFDAREASGRSGFLTPDGVVVVFESEGSADDRIAEEAAHEGDRCLVVTSDRDLQARCGRDGCVVVFSEAVLAWSEPLNGDR